MKVDHYSYSSHKLYEACPNRFKLSKLCPTVKGIPPEYITFGQNYHKEVENYHRGLVYDTKLVETYTKQIKKDFFSDVEVEIRHELTDIDTGKTIDVPFVLRIDGVNDDGLWDLKTTTNTVNQNVLNKSDQVTLYCYVWYLLFAKIPIFHYIIFSKKNNTIKFKETYRSKTNFKEFFTKMEEFDRKVKNDEFQKQVGYQCLTCPFAEDYCLNSSLLEVLKKTSGKL